MLKYLTNANSVSARNKNGDLCLVGIVSGITKKKDAKGNPIAFIEMEDLNGKFEVPLFNKDFTKYAQTLKIGKVYMVTGSKSQYNGTDDGLLRLMPDSIIAFANLKQELKGLMHIRVLANHVTKGYLREISSWINDHPGLVSLQVEIQSASNDFYVFQSERQIFPNNQILSWLEKHGLEFSLDISTNGKDS
jgi:DNA polymerase III alpha subunit